MNIDKIVKECPRAWEEWLRWYWESYEELQTPNIKIEALINDIRCSFNEDTLDIIFWSKDEGIDFRNVFFRLLYDYFDSVGIYINCETLERDFWECTIFYIDGQGLAPITNADNRTEAEYRAFERAFEIRERQLNNSK